MFYSFDFRSEEPLIIPSSLTWENVDAKRYFACTHNTYIHLYNIMFIYMILNWRHINLDNLTSLWCRNEWRSLCVRPFILNIRLTKFGGVYIYMGSQISHRLEYRTHYLKRMKISRTLLVSIESRDHSFFYCSVHKCQNNRAYRKCSKLL